MNNINKQFSTHAKDYNSYNIIQQILSKALVRELSFKPKRILELGCGSGQIFKNIDFNFEYYKAIDFSLDMCNIHPKKTNLDVICLDFDSEDFRKNVAGEKYDIVISSSALQWSKDLTKIVKTIKDVSENISMALFTSNTFKEIFKITQKNSPILDIKTIKNSFDNYFDCEYEILNYNLEFNSKKKLFDYIKNSGVGGGNSILSFKEAKKLYKEYNLNYLEFEVVFIKGVKC